MTKERNETNIKSLKSLAKGLVMLIGLGAIVYLTRAVGLGSMLADTKWFNDQVLGTGPLSVVIFLAVSAVFTAIGLPRQLVGFLGGFAFGVVSGTVLSTVGSGLGCALAALYARMGGRELVQRKLGSKVEKVNRFLQHEPFNTSLAIRLFPLGSNLITNLAAGVSSIPLSSFILGSTLGYVPQNFIFALFGAGMNRESTMGVALSVGMSIMLFVLSGWMGLRIYGRYKKELKAAENPVD
ncbi:TVP38/TMEM64 family protein [Pseudodesulfovibrio sediminis]|uniref:TVP38/TMEM64 family membrane protein n=1 Tax=Pseudodesulfovibrio sediminis TaxID=2810563 RepID=A0ABN6EQX5_9BACT|nr:VTT domain-containing protein [Pseudodesulfovibrio sediminis]BCS87620.1 TVP38/TMEM64 family protein [Pseudodesulfovibrio sediminis]